MVKPTIDAIDVDPKTGTTLGFYHFGEDRPNILILSAAEGHSAGCVYTSYLLMKYLEDLDRIDGSVAVLPVSNPLAFRLGARVSPLDSQALDTVFPGSEFGTVTERLAWEIWRKAAQADYVIQLRSSPQSCVSHVIGLHRDYIHVRNLASQIGLPFVIQGNGTRGTLNTEAAIEGIPTVSIELRGYRDQIEVQASVEVRKAILNFMRIKGMIPGESIETSSVYTSRVLSVNSEAEGFFIPSVNLGDTVPPESSIGVVEGASDVLCSFSGTVISLSRMNYVFEGDKIASIATPLLEQRGPVEEDEKQS
ncbi:MAG: succinylglutamate desuccinylase/aspartoacylase family protein, partial [Candidatus Thorarchaeota archaeon]|nr:succinylglutamate desuccinylase/aspartoacylase family protein [Candidatus Thorarchaeota archaeon]